VSEPLPREVGLQIFLISNSPYLRGKGGFLDFHPDTVPSMKSLKYCFQEATLCQGEQRNSKNTNIIPRIMAVGQVYKGDDTCGCLVLNWILDLVLCIYSGRWFDIEKGRSDKR